ncbi:hypothetical protein HOG21_05245 [bacterium]|nr:hypothetical protein [bacterium]
MHFISKFLKSSIIKEISSIFVHKNPLFKLLSKYLNLTKQGFIFNQYFSSKVFHSKLNIHHCLSLTNCNNSSIIFLLFSINFV